MLNGSEIVAFIIVIVIFVILGIIALIIVIATKASHSISDVSEKREAERREKEESEIRGEDITEGKEKIGVIISNLEGLLTEDNSFWETLNTEMEIIPEGEWSISENLSEKIDYPRYIKKIFSKWRELKEEKPNQFNREFFSDFFKKYLRIRNEAREFIEYCKNNYIFYVISEAPWEFCLLAKEQLGFYHYYATTIFAYNKNNQLERIVAHKDGFQKERIISRIIKTSKFNENQAIVITNSKKDINMINGAKFSVIVGRDMFPPTSELKPSVISLPELNFDNLKNKIDQITKQIRQAGDALTA